MNISQLLRPAPASGQMPAIAPNASMGPPPQAGFRGMLDGFGTNVGDAIISAQNPFGAEGITPEMRRQQIGMALLKMGGDVDSTARRGGGVLEGLGHGIENLQQGGMQGGMMRLQGQQAMESIAASREEREAKKKMNDSLRAMISGGAAPAGPQPGDSRMDPSAAKLPTQGLSKAKRAQALFWLQAGQPEKAAAAVFGSDDPASWSEVQTEDGVFMVNTKDPTQKLKIGERANRNEGEGREFAQEDKIRASYIKEAKPFQDLRVNFQRMKAASKDETGASDIAMVYSFMKMLDPTSVVREGEFATAQNAGGVDSQVISMYNRILSGERLAPQVRKEFMQQSNRQYREQMKSYEETKKVFQTTAKSYGLDPARVTPDLTFGVLPDPDEAAPLGAPGADGWVTTPSGIRIRKKM